MVQPVTTTEVLLAQVVDLLTEVRDLLPAATAAQPPAKNAAAKKAAPSRAAKKTSTTKS